MFGTYAIYASSADPVQMPQITASEQGQLCFTGSKIDPRQGALGLNHRYTQEHIEISSEALASDA